ncbi:alpha/beta hydrolase-fold protein [Flavicella sp.]|uniref:alpha/beta hydrolase-fold protein n=1 Tax=Flavicella sp. TaxID=2957742 RepID=UPI00261BF161|nr:alpha/beta hydrolase-fold protein [Flavicella sp.]MDG1805930.1 alpha/beta hydrolase-fold protein [Flavicella sp.]
MLLYATFRSYFNKTQHKFYFWTVLLMCLAGLTQAAVVFLQYNKTMTSGNPFFKLTGTFYSPNILGSFLGVCLTSICCILFLQKRYLKTKHILFLTIPGIILMFCFINTQSRGAWLGFLVSIVTLMLTSKSFKTRRQSLHKLTSGILFGLLIVMMIVGTKLLYNLKPDSVDGRLFAAKITITEILKKPLIGHGTFSFAKVYNKSKVEYFENKDRPWNEIKNATYEFTPFNDYLLIAVELGIPFLILLMFLLYCLFIASTINKNTRYAIAILANLLICALFNNLITNLSLMTLFFLALSLLATFGEFRKTKITMSLPKTITQIILLFLCVFTIKEIHSNNSNRKTFNEFYSHKEKSKMIDSMVVLHRTFDSNLYHDLKLARIMDNNKVDAIPFLEERLIQTSAPRIGRELAHLYYRKGNIKRTEELYKFNSLAEPYRYEARMDLLNLYLKTNNSSKANHLAKTIIDFPVKVPSKKVDYFKRKAKKVFQESKNNVQSNQLQGSLSRNDGFKSRILNRKLPFRVYLPPTEFITSKLPVIYIHDGNSYIHGGKLPQLLDSLIANQKINPVVAVFVTPKDLNNKQEKIRQELYLCNPKFVDFFKKEFMPFIEKKYPISMLKKDRSMMGYSFGGLVSAYIGAQATDSFQNIIMQSPAFHPCPEIYNCFKYTTKKDLNIYLSYGTGDDTENQDLPMIKILNDKNYNLKVDRVEKGNHDWKAWKPQLETILMHFFEQSD